MTLRKTSQDLAPLYRPSVPAGQYDLYPAFPLDDGKIAAGFEVLAAALRPHQRVVIDGYVGVFWAQWRDQLDAALRAQGVVAAWCDIGSALLPEAEIDCLIAPFMGGDDPIFGTRYTGTLADFFHADKLASLRPAPDAALSILYGCGAALAGWENALLVYVDVPKNEIQFRSRAGGICNLGAAQPTDSKGMYKRFYFVDWVVLNAHKATLTPRIDLLIDGQRADAPTFAGGSDVRAALTQMSHNVFRVRPWFEPGAWGGQWIKQHIPQLPQDAPNYAWSFELIVPENGLMLESGGVLLEMSFDFLMYHDHQAVLGDCAARFGYDFPIRFDFLDTFDGGNLSVQCHPRPDYAQQHFGESFTQDETYYILDCGDDAAVYLGFQDGIDPQAFRADLERSIADGSAVDIEQYVQVFPAHKHDLFLIPNGTIHCSGKNNLVLEISATPYIFTFKMYDWLRLDLDGKPRPLNIDRAFENLRFERQGARVPQELIAKPYVQAEGSGWRRVHVPTHAQHFYDVRRYELDAGISLEVKPDGSPQVMSLVEGETILLETAGGMRQRFSYAETFVIPAAAGHFRLINDSHAPIKVVNGFMKADAQ
jgi:mannose-6-phosphate isomerase class I